MAGLILQDPMWRSRGISLLWDAESLGEICTPQQVVSLRRFLQLGSLGWPEEQLLLVDEKRLVVAGLESAIDSLPPEEATDWLEQVVYRCIVSFEREVSRATEAALVLWLSERRRLEYSTSDDTYYWHCATEFKGHMIPLSRCLFNGGQGDARRIHSLDGSKKEPWIGLFHPKVSS